MRRDHNPTRERGTNTVGDFVPRLRVGLGFFVCSTAFSRIELTQRSTIPAKAGTTNLALNKITALWGWDIATWFRPVVDVQVVLFRQDHNPTRERGTSNVGDFVPHLRVGLGYFVCSTAFSRIELTQRSTIPAKAGTTNLALNKITALWGWDIATWFRPGVDVQVVLCRQDHNPTRKRGTSTVGDFVPRLRVGLGFFVLGWASDLLSWCSGRGNESRAFGTRGLVHYNSLPMHSHSAIRFRLSGLRV